MVEPEPLFAASYAALPKAQPPTAKAVPRTPEPAAPAAAAVQPMAAASPMAATSPKTAAGGVGPALSAEQKAAVLDRELPNITRMLTARFAAAQKALSDYAPRAGTSAALEKRARAKLQAAMRRELTDLRLLCPHVPFAWTVVRAVAEATGDGDDLEVATADLLTYSAAATAAAAGAGAAAASGAASGAAAAADQTALSPHSSAAAAIAAVLSDDEDDDARDRLLRPTPPPVARVNPLALRSFTGVRTLYTAYCPVCGRVCEQHMPEHRLAFSFAVGGSSAGSAGGGGARASAVRSGGYRPSNTHVNPQSGVFAPNPPPVASLAVQSDEEFRHDRINAMLRLGKENGAVACFDVDRLHIPELVAAYLSVASDLHWNAIAPVAPL